MTTYPYGLLNPVKKEKFKRRVETNSNNSLVNIRDAALETLYTDNLSLEGEFVGYILRNVKESEKAIDSPSFWDSIWDSAAPAESKPKTIKVKVRVPEVHALLPEPYNAQDKRAIDLHTTFQYLREDEPPSMEPGTLVKVSFYDSQGNWKPTLKEVLAGTDGLMASNNVGPAAPFRPSGELPGEGISGRGASQIVTLEQLPSSQGRTIVEINKGIPFRQNRVRVHEGIGMLPMESPLAVPVTTAPNRGTKKLHVLAAKRYEALRAAALEEANLEFFCWSGLRRGWSSRDAYDRKIRKTYVNNPSSKYFYENVIDEFERKGENISVQEAKKISFKRGSKKIAWSSPHFTGLAIDFYCKGELGEVDMAPSAYRDQTIKGKFIKKEVYGTQTNYLQKRTTAFQWLKNNAHRFGFTPLLSEAWHWECLIPTDNWRSGEEFVENQNYNVRIAEKSVANGTLTSNRNFSFGEMVASN